MTTTSAQASSVAEVAEHFHDRVVEILEKFVDDRTCAALAIATLLSRELHAYDTFIRDDDRNCLLPAGAIIH